MIKIKYVDGDLFDIVDNYPNPVVIPHVCNDRGLFGAGFVVPLSAKYPVVKESYTKWFMGTYTSQYVYQPSDEEIYWSNDWCNMGEIQIIKPKDNIYVVNMIAQTISGKRPLYYNFLCSCMDKVADWLLQNCSLGHIICPQFGAGLAGGDWKIIEKLIEDCWVRAGINVTVVRYKK